VQLNNKIKLISLFPLLLLLLIATYSADKAYTQVSKSQDIIKNIKKNEHKSTLISQLSKERALASSLIATENAESKVFSTHISENDFSLLNSNKLQSLKRIRLSIEKRQTNFQELFYDVYSNAILTPLFKEAHEEYTISLNPEINEISTLIKELYQNLENNTFQRDYLSYFIAKNQALSSNEMLSLFQHQPTVFNTDKITNTQLREDTKLYLNSIKEKQSFKDAEQLFLQVQNNFNDGQYNVSIGSWINENSVKIDHIQKLIKKNEITLLQKIEAYNTNQSIILYVSLFLLALSLIFSIMGFIAFRELRHNINDLEEMLSNSIIDGDDVYDEVEMSLYKNIDLKSKEGMRNAYKLIETLIENAKSDKIEAIEANASKSLFLANMSHEIRTPLNGIVGFTELLKSTNLDDEQKEFINIVEKSSENLLSIINNILDLSKIESNKTELDIIIFDPIVEFENAVETYGIRASEKNIELDFFLDPAIDKKLLGDSVKIKEVLINLLSNAIKFTDLGGKIKVEIKKVSTIENQTEIAFSIEDNGVGMTKEQQLNVFSAFTQADVSITRKYGGTGLGLTISTKFLELMGAELKLESQKEKGTRFYFNIVFEEVLESTEIAMSPKFEDMSICKFNYDLPVQQDVYLSQYFKSFNVEHSGFNTASDLKKCNEDKNLKSIWIDVDNTEDNLLKTIYKINSQKIILLSSFSNRDKLENLGINVAKILYKPITPTKVIQGLNASNSIKIEKTLDISKASPFKNIQFQGNILVAEDNFINQKLIKQVLLRYGVTVELANNGLEAFEKRKSETYDLIFMDIQMPVMDGVEATHEIINYEVEEELQHIPIVALTANALNGDRERFMSEGLDEYIPKPIETNELLYILKKFLTAKPEEVKKNITKKTQTILEPIANAGIEKNTDGIMILEEEIEKDDSSIKLILDEPTQINEIVEVVSESTNEVKKILIVKKNPLEAQILSKVIANLNYEIEIVHQIEELTELIQNSKYDILLIDKEIEQFNQSILKKQHSAMNIIVLSQNKPNNEYFNTNLIKEVHIGIIKREKIEQLIKKYRRV